MAMNLTTKAKIRSKLAARGIHLTDSQIEQYAAKHGYEDTQPAIDQPEAIYPERGDDISDEWGVVDAIGSSLWSFFDTATFGGTLEEGLIGGGSGAIVQGLIALALGRRARGATTGEPTAPAQGA